MKYPQPQQRAAHQPPKPPEPTPAPKAEPEPVGAYTETLECRQDPDGAGMLYRLRIRAHMKGREREHVTEWLSRDRFNMELAVANRTRIRWVAGGTL